MSKHGANIPPPNVHHGLVNMPQGNMPPRPGAGGSSHASFNLEQSINGGPLDTSNAPEGQDVPKEGSAVDKATEPVKLSEEESGHKLWEAGDEEKVMKFATSGGGDEGEGSGGAKDGDKPPESGMLMNGLAGLGALAIWARRYFRVRKTEEEERKIKAIDENEQLSKWSKLLMKKGQGKPSGNMEGTAQQQQSGQNQPGTRHPVSKEEVYETMDILAHLLPPELITPIIEFAEYYVHTVIGRRNESRSVNSNGISVYLTCRIPDFEAWEPDTEGKGGRTEEITEGESSTKGKEKSHGRKAEMGRLGRMRKLIFKIKSHDQGWSSNEGQGTYVGAYSWIDLEVYRKKSAILAEKAAHASEKPIAEKTAQSEEEAAHQNDYSSDPTPTEDDDDDDDILDTMVKIDGPLTLQCNVHAKRESTEHVIVWDHHEDQLSDEDPEKWEDGEINNWYRNGHIGRNGEFVRKLRGGDELRIIMKCQYSGWSCTVDSCEVEAVWAV